MTDLKVTGQGSQRAASQLGEMIGKGVTAAAAGMEQSLHIETLRLKLPVGANQSDINRALRRALSEHGNKP
jgi:hypothetical protein